LRIVRGGALALSSTSLAIAAHGVAGGSFPDFSGLLMMALLVAAAGAVLADRQRSRPAIVGALASAHLATHVLLSMDPMRMASDTSPKMLLAHVLGVLATGVILAKAETAIFAISAALARLVPLLAPRLASTSESVLNWGYATTSKSVGGRCLHTVVSRRGPPVVN
jgi:hypothetical protein